MVELNDFQQATILKNLDETLHAPKTYDYFAHPQWSPDGTRISVEKTVIQGIDLGPLQQIAIDTGLQDKVLSQITTTTHFIMTMQPDGSDLRQVTDQCSDSAWSPDNQWLVCTSSTNGNNNESELYLVNISNGSMFRLTNTPDDEYAPDWSP